MFWPVYTYADLILYIALILMGDNDKEVKPPMNHTGKESQSVLYIDGEVPKVHLGNAKARPGKPFLFKRLADYKGNADRTPLAMERHLKPIQN